jgi:hypothetical protein
LAFSARGDRHLGAGTGLRPDLGELPADVGPLFINGAEASLVVQVDAIASRALFENEDLGASDKGLDDSGGL